MADFDPTSFAPVEMGGQEPRAAFDPGSFQEVDLPDDIAAHEESKKVVSMPAGLNGPEADYMTKRQVQGRERGDFYGVHDLGLGSGLDMARRITTLSNPMFTNPIQEKVEEYAPSVAKGLGAFAAGDIPKVVGGTLREFGERTAEATRANMTTALDLVRPLPSPDASLREENAAPLDMIGDVGTRMNARIDRFVQESGLARPEADKEGNVKPVLYDFGRGLGSVASAIGLTYLTGNPAAASALFGQLQKTSTYEAAREKNVSPRTAGEISTDSGIVEGSLEAVGNAVFQQLAHVNGPVKQVVMRGIEEATQEASQQAGQEFILETTGIEDKPMTESLANIGYAALLGFATGAPVAVVMGKVEEQAKQQNLRPETAKMLVNKLSQTFMASPELQNEVKQLIGNGSSMIADDPQTRKATGEIMWKFANGEPIETPPGVQPDIAAQGSQLEGRIKRDLIAAGRPEEEATTNATLTKAAYESLSQRYPGLQGEIDRAFTGLTVGQGTQTGDFNQGANVTATPEFKTWFGESQVKDAEGQPLKVYHGTQQAFEEFEPQTTRNLPSAELGFWFTDSPERAGGYTNVDRTGSKGNIVPVYLKVENPYPATTKEVQDLITPDEVFGFREGLEMQGYDGIVMEMPGSGGAKAYVAFQPTQIKSPFNQGTFDPNDPRILYQSGREQDDLGFFRKAAEVAEAKLPNTGTPEQMTQNLDAYARNGDFKAEELEYSGVKEWLSSKTGKVSKADVAAFLREGGVKLEEVQKSNVEPTEYVSEDEETGEWNIHSEDGEIIDTGYASQRAAEREIYARAGVTQNIAGERDINRGNTKFEKYTLPGGTNYREVLLTLPTQDTEAALRQELNNEQTALASEMEAMGTRMRAVEGRPSVEMETEYDGIRARWDALQKRRAEAAKGYKKNQDATYRSSHYDEPNILAHFRLNDRTDADGKKVLFIEEIQSDWHQAGRKKGYAGKLPEGMEIEERPDPLTGGTHFTLFRMEDGEKVDIFNANTKAALEQYAAARGGQVPDAPFKKTWQDLALKRILRMAAEGGYDKVAWTTGEQQAERYDLSKQIERLDWTFKDGKYRLYPVKDGAALMVFDGRQFEASELEEVIGKEVAKKITEATPDAPFNEKRGTKEGKLEGVDLKVGGEGMKGFYDNILPKAMDKLVKKWGGKVGKVDLEGIPKLNDSKRRVRDTIAEIESSKAYREGGFEALRPQTKETLQKLRKEAEDFPADLTEPAVNHALDLTPAIKAGVMQGQELFQGPRITRSPRGSIKLGNQVAAINLFQNADASTFLHETGHFYWATLDRLAQNPRAPKQLKDDVQTIREFVGAKPGETLTVEQEEKRTRAVEAYLMVGKAPSQKLAGVFERFRQWLRDVYKSVKALKVEITPEVRAVLDRVFATDEEMQAVRGRAIDVERVGKLRFLDRQIVGLDTQIEQLDAALAEVRGDSPDRQRLERQMARLQRERAALDAQREAIFQGGEFGGAIEMRAGDLERLAADGLERKRRALEQGLREGARLARTDVKAAQEQLLAVIGESGLEAKDKAKFLATLKNVQTAEQLEKALPVVQARIGNLLEAQAVRDTKAKLLKILKKTKAKKQSGKPKGRFTPDIQDTLDRLRLASQMSVGEAEAKLEANLASDDPTPEMALENQVLSVLIGTDSGTLRETLKSVQDLIGEGKMEAADIQLERAEKMANLRMHMLTAVEGGEDRTLVDKTKLSERLGEMIRDARGEIYRGQNSFTDLLNLVTGNDKTGAKDDILETLGYQLTDAWRAREGVAREATEKATGGMMTAFGFTRGKQMLDQMAADSKKVDLGTFVNAAGTPVRLQMSKAEARKRWMEMQDPTLMETLVAPNGNAYTPEMIQTIEEFLTPQDKAFAEAQLDFYRWFYPQVNAVYSLVYGVNLPNNPNYSPISRRHNREAEVDTFKGEMEVRRSAAPGGLKSRVNTKNPLKDMNDFATLQRHIGEMSHFIALQEKVQELSAVINTNDIRDAIKDRYGQVVLSTFDDYLQDFAKGQVKVLRDGLSWFESMRQNFSAAVLGAKPALALKQMTAFVAYAENIPAKDFAEGFAETLANPIKAAKILGESELMKARGSNLERDIMLAEKSAQVGNFRKLKKFRNAMYYFVQAGDRASLIMGGYPVYLYHRKQGKSHEQALKAFERATARSQQMSDLDQLSRLQASGSVGSRTMTMFMSGQNQFYRRETQAFLDFARGTIKGEELVKRVLIYHFIAPMLFQFVADFFRFDPGNQARAAIFGSLNGFFIGFELLDKLLKKLMGEDTFGGSGVVSSIGQFGSKMLDGVMKLTDEDADTDEVNAAMNKIASGFGEMVGLPVGRLWDVVEGLSLVSEGEEGAGTAKVLGFPRSVVRDIQADEDL